MPDPVVVIGTITAGILGGIGLWWTKRASAKAGVGVTQPEAITNLQLIADTWEERFNLVTADLVAERAAHGVTKALLADEQSAGDRCRRELGQAESDLRALQRQRGQS